MAIEMIPGEFPELRRSDPKRNAEARVYDALRNLELDGRGIYEFRYREGGRQLDFALWLDGIGRFAVQVKGGEYQLDATGQWSLRNPDGNLTPTGSPLEETVDGRIELREGIRQATNYWNFIAGVLIFPDMQRDVVMERAALNHEMVHIIWGLDALREDLERIAGSADFRRPPKPRHSDNEWQQVNELQYRPDNGRERDTGQRAPNPAEGQAADGEADVPLAVGSATFNIQHLEKMVVQHFHLDQDAEGIPVVPEV